MSLPAEAIPFFSPLLPLFVGVFWKPSSVVRIHPCEITSVLRKTILLRLCFLRFVFFRVLQPVEFFFLFFSRFFLPRRLFELLPIDHIGFPLTFRSIVSLFNVSCSIAPLFCPSVPHPLPFPPGGQSRNLDLKYSSIFVSNASFARDIALLRPRQSRGTGVLSPPLL